LGIQEREWEDGVGRENNEREYGKKNTGN
jgi:hypothetical protein